MEKQEDRNSKQSEALSTEHSGTHDADNRPAGEWDLLVWRSGDPGSVLARRDRERGEDHSGRRFDSCFEEATRALGPEPARALFEREDVDALVGRAEAFKTLSMFCMGPTTARLCTIEDLADRTEAVIGELEANRGPLVRDGLPATGPATGWPAGPLVNLYPIESSWLTTWPDREEWDRLRDAELGHNFVNIPYRWLEPADAARLIAGRVALLDLKIDVLRTLVRALRTRNPTRLWPDCLQLLTDALTASEVDFYLGVDARVGPLYPLGGPVDDEYGGHKPLGGLAALLEFIGHCEEELRIGAMDWATRNLPTGLTVAPSSSYFATIGQPWQADLDATLDRLVELRGSVGTFWTEYRDRVDFALRSEFHEEAVTRTRLKPPLAATFEPQIRKIAEMGRAHLELMGTFPSIAFTPATGQPASTNVFRKGGDTWTITYAGETIQLLHSLGLSYIALLLRTPNEGRSAASLAAGLAQATPSPVGREFGHMNREQLGQQGMRIAGSDDALNMADQSTLDLVKRQWAELNEDLRQADEHGDRERASQLRQQIQRLEEYATANTGPRGRPRRAASDPNEKVRKAVSNAIKRSRKSIEKDHRALGRHLRYTIRTGDVCSYEPGEPAPPWDL